MSSQIVISPRRLAGSPAIEGTRIGPDLAAHYVLSLGLDETLTSYPHLTRDDVLVACWYVARYDPPKRWKPKDWARLKGWLVLHEEALWSDEDWSEVPLP